MKTNCLILAVLLATSFGASAQTLSNYQATIKSQGPMSYFTFDNGSTANAVVTNTATLTLIGSGLLHSGWTGGFTSDVFNNPSNAVFFSASHNWDTAQGPGGGAIFNGGGAPTSTSTNAGSISFLFQTLNSTNTASGRKTLFSAGGGLQSTNSDGSTNFGNAFIAFFEQATNKYTDPSALKLRFGNSSTTILPASNIVLNTWYYMAVTYTELGTVTNKCTWYLGRAGGPLMSGVTTNLPTDVAGDAAQFLIGNNTNYTDSYRNSSPNSTGVIDEFAAWNRQLTTNEVQAQFAKLPQFAQPGSQTVYEGIITNQSPFYYFKMDGTYLDSVTGTAALTTNTGNEVFGGNWFGGQDNSIIFGGSAHDGVSNTVQVLSGGGIATTNLGTGKGSLSCLFRTPNTTNFPSYAVVFEAPGATTTTNGLSLFIQKYTNTVTYSGDFRLRFGDKEASVLPASNYVGGVWYYFAMSYDETVPTNQVNWWLGQAGGTLSNGVLSATAGALAGLGSTTTSNMVIGNKANMADCFRGTNSSTLQVCPGQIDQFAIWHRVLSANEVTSQFSALVPASAQSPVLNIAVSGANALITWPSTTDAGYALQSTTNLTPPAAWVGAGSPGTVGANNVVTNALGSGAKYYRLKK